MNLLAAAAVFFAAPAAAGEPARGPMVSVGIARSVPWIEILPEGEFTMIDVKGGEITKLERGVPYRIEADQGRLIVGKHLFPGTARLLPGAPGERVVIGGKKYRGNILFRPNLDESLTVIDELDLEDYLEGVLPKEMSPGWHMEALKAQAVVSRSFALAKLGKNGDKGYDLRDDAFSQVYDGQSSESERIRRAVRETAGQVLVYDGKLLPGYFHSTCAGRTTSPGSVWGSSAPTPKPLRGVRDRWCKISPHYKWTAYFRTGDMLRRLQQRGYDALRLRDIRPGLRDAGGFLRTLDFLLDGGWRGLRAHAFRIWMGVAELKSTKIRRIIRRRQGYHFVGRGYGHGVGLCQWGARGQAERGRSYRRILRHYFPGAKIRFADPGWLSRLEP